MKELTWDELACLYDAVHHGRPARTLPMDTVFNWAVSQTKQFRITKDGSLTLKEE